MKKRQRNVTAEAMRDSPPPSTEPTVVERPFPPPSRPHMATYLENIRNEALQQQGQVNAAARKTHDDVQRTIADLEDWRNEIDATIALLRATQK